MMNANAIGLSAQDARKTRILGGQHGQGWLGLAAVALWCLVAAHPTAQAVQSYPAPVTVSQPDGSAIQVVLRGDEFYHWHEDAAGYSVIQDAQNGQ